MSNSTEYDTHKASMLRMSSSKGKIVPYSYEHGFR